MPYPNKRGRPGDTVATSEGKLAGCYDSESNTKRPFKQEASFEVFKRRVVALETVADWQDDLNARINRAQLRFELIGFDIDEQRALYAEGQAFKRVCRALAYSGRAVH